CTVLPATVPTRFRSNARRPRIVNAAPAPAATRSSPSPSREDASVPSRPERTTPATPASEQPRPLSCRQPRRSPRKPTPKAAVRAGRLGGSEWRRRRWRGAGRRA
ncbi:MAG: hypothetical protein AVDCRST_MAG19-2688, partial [uncultured Thermomicrobiales bacterium]